MWILRKSFDVILINWLTSLILINTWLILDFIKLSYLFAIIHGSYIFHNLQGHSWNEKCYFRQIFVLDTSIARSLHLRGLEKKHFGYKASHVFVLTQTLFLDHKYLFCLKKVSESKSYQRGKKNICIDQWLQKYYCILKRTQAIRGIG